MRSLLVVAGVMLLVSLWPACHLYDEIDKAQSEDPLVWEDDIRVLEAAANGPPGSVIFLGSSSIRLWKNLADDMAPMTTIRRGFGGAKFNDAVYYARRLVSAPDPAAIVVFVGTNDIQPEQVKTAEVLLGSYRLLVANIRQVHRQTPIYYIGITPSPQRWQVWPQARKTNDLIRTFADGDPSLHFIDTSLALMSNGEPKAENYIFDGLHLSADGYAIWTAIIRARLLEDGIGPPRS